MRKEYLSFTIRLQRPWDVDLITLSRNKDFDFADWARKALIAWGKGDENFVIPCPPKGDLSDVSQNKVCVIIDREDSDIIEKFNQINDGLRNSFLKNLIRHYLDRPYAYIYGPDFLFNDMPAKKSTVTDKTKENTKENRLESIYIPESATVQSDTVDKEEEAVVQNDVPETAEILEIKEDIDENKEEQAEFDLFGAIDQMM